ncbi:MAG: hypothetical protein V7K25_03225 [Nostoc sp.]
MRSQSETIALNSDSVWTFAIASATLQTKLISDLGVSFKGVPEIKLPNF